MMREAIPISGKTHLVGLIGWPVGHSVSPAMHNAAFAYLGLDWRYVPFPVNPDDATGIGAAVHGLRALGLRGANVTVPHKQAVMPHLDRLTPAAQLIGAVNTITVDANGDLVGDNTDAPGFVADLHSHGVDADGLHVLVLGAGGSARAVVCGLATAGAARVAILNRTIERAQALVDDLQPLYKHCHLSAHRLPEAIGALASPADLIVNCTSLGMTPNTETNPWDAQTPFRAGQVVYDLVYNPPVTRLLLAAAADGARPLGGLGMLIWQGALAFEQWTGQPAPVDAMRGAAAAHFALREREKCETRPAITVRPAHVADAGAIAALNAFLQHVHADAHPEFFKQPSSFTFPAAYVAELMVKPDTVILVVTLDGTVAGYLYGDTTPAIETTMTFAFARFYIHQIAVAPAAQGCGCGAALIQAAREHAHTRGLGTLALSVWDFNRKARRFFERQGFTNYNHRMWIKGV